MRYNIPERAGTGVPMWKAGVWRIPIGKRFILTRSLLYYLMFSQCAYITFLKNALYPRTSPLWHWMAT